MKNLVLRISLLSAFTFSLSALSMEGHEASSSSKHDAKYGCPSMIKTAYAYFPTGDTAKKVLVGALALGIIAMPMMAPLSLAFAQPLPQQDLVTSRAFERQHMSSMSDEPATRVEGYWRQSKVQSAPYPWPTARSEKWIGQDEFVAKLASVEAFMEKHDHLVHYRGMSQSRIDDSIVGSAEFYDDKAKIAWPEGYRTHYVEKYNVVPSQEFYDYIMNFNLG